MTVSAVLAAVFLVSAMVSPADAAPRDPSSILVKFSIPSQTNGILQAFGDRIGARLTDGVIVVRLPGGASVDTAVARYSRLFGVGYAEPNYIASADALASPNDPSYPSQWSLTKIAAVNGWSALVPSYPTTTSGATIAVIDTGVQADHPDLAGKVLSGANCLTGTCVAGTAADDNSHGTHVAGIAAARTNNGVGIAGVALTSPVLPVKALDSSGSGSYASITAAINWAVSSGARVINMSLTGSVYSTTLCNAVANAVAANVVVVAAAGNSSSSSSAYPAACSGAIGVAATDGSDSSAYYSNYGSPNVFVSAPGSDIYSTVNGSGYGFKSGTSMAAPHVAGLVGLLRTQSPGISVSGVKSVLATTSDKISGYSFGADPYGTCTGCTWSSSLGYGRINIERALGSGGGTPPPPPPPPPPSPPPAPSLGSFTVSGITQSQATLGGTVNPNGAMTSWQVRYGPTTAYTAATTLQSVGSGTTSTGVSVFLTGLMPGTTYHYSVRASSANGTTDSTDATFATSPVSAPPPSGSITVGFPSTVTIINGSPVSGGAANLTGIDGSYYALSSPFLSSPSWYGTFNVAPNPSEFKVTYNGRSSRTCNLSLSLYRWTTGTWIAAVSSVSVGTTAVTVTNAAPSASVQPADLRSASGQVRVRASCSGGGFSFTSFTLSNDLLQLSYRS